jgi:hypothetical protein
MRQTDKQTDRDRDRDRDICSRDEVCGWEVEGSGAGIRPEKVLRFCCLFLERRREEGRRGRSRRRLRCLQ